MSNFECTNGIWMNNHYRCCHYIYFLTFYFSLVEGNGFILSGKYLSFTNVKLLLSQHRCYNSPGVWRAVAPWAYHANSWMHRHGDRGAHALTHTHTYRSTPVYIRRVPVCQQLSPPLITPMDASPPPSTPPSNPPPEPPSMLWPARDSNWGKLAGTVRRWGRKGEGWEEREMKRGREGETIHPRPVDVEWHITGLMCN